MPERKAASHSDELARLRGLANRMDRVFRVPLIGVRIGWDPILGLVPGIGDALTLAPAIYILYRAHRMGVPPTLLARMGANVGLDALVGTVPLLGDLFDAAWRANIRNVDLLQRHLERRTAKAPPDEQVERHLSSHHPTLGGRTDKPQ